MYKLVIFDLDDCLIDSWSASFPESINSAVQAMVNKGLKVEDFNKAVERLNEINNTSKNSAEAITKYLNEISESVSKYMKHGKKAIHFFNLEGKIKPLPKALETIRKLNESAIDLAIVTSGEEGRQIKKIKDAGININKFRKIFAVTDYNKTAPYKKALNEFQYSPKEVLVVGDRYKTDLIPASNLGMKTAWIPWGRGKVFAPKKTEVDYILTNISEISKIIKSNKS
ncbi:HAD family hydrolase [archaeon]|nr:HAD family hydrolase [archaeon]